MKFTPTQEQLACIEAAKANANLKILACAGGTKTTTLSLIAEAIVEPSIYLAFNKSTALEAAQRFPKHVNPMTTHSAAFKACGVDIQHKLTRPVGKYVNVAGTGSEIARYFKINGLEEPYVSANFIGLLVKRTVERFEQSADKKIESHHVPMYELPKEFQKDNKVNKYIRDLAKKLWEKRITPDSYILATHDTYLKLYQLSKPKLTGKVLYVDEFHDTTDCVLDIVRNQSHMKTIVVGDRYQNIYGWRGAKNALDDFDVTTCYLTQSFRYGQAVADVANKVLEDKTNIKGFDKIKSIVGRNVVDTTKPYTHLFRTNSALLLAAISNIEKGIPTLISIDTRDFVKILQSAIALSEGDMNNVKHERILPFSEFKELVEEGKHDGELNRIAAAIKNGQARRMIQILETYKVPANPIATFTTSHKVKGLEYDQVILADDFPSHYGKKGAWVGLTEGERNLLYVAATRAKKVLEINDSIEEVLERSPKHRDTAINSIDGLISAMALDGINGHDISHLHSDDIQDYMIHGE